MEEENKKANNDMQVIEADSEEELESLPALRRGDSDGSSSQGSHVKPIKRVSFNKEDQVVEICNADIDDVLPDGVISAGGIRRRTLALFIVVFVFAVFTSIVAVWRLKTHEQTREHQLIDTILANEAVRIGSIMKSMVGTVEALKIFVMQHETTTWSFDPKTDLKQDERWIRNISMLPPKVNPAKFDEACRTLLRRTPLFDPDAPPTHFGFLLLPQGVANQGYPASGEDLERGLYQKNFISQSEKPINFAAYGFLASVMQVFINNVWWGAVGVATPTSVLLESTVEHPSVVFGSREYHWELTSFLAGGNMSVPQIVAASYLEASVNSNQSYILSESRIGEVTSETPRSVTIRLADFQPMTLRVVPRAGYITLGRPWWPLFVALLVDVVVAALVACMAHVALHRFAKMELQESEIKRQAQLEFLGFIYHELRNPAHALQSFLELAPAKVREWEDYDRVIGCVLLLRRIMDNSLDFMKLESGKMELALLATDIREVVDECGGMGRMRLRRMQTLETTVDDSVPCEVMVDPLRYQQVVLNLVNNACKFCASAVRIRVEYDEANQMLHTEVTNDGGAISAEDQKKLFKSYTQVKERNAREHGGTGLGLCVSQALVRLMGGRIEVDGEGEAQVTKFCFAIPAATHVRERLHSSRNNSVVSLDESTASARVLFVDDNELNRIVGGKTLEDVGVAVADFAEDGRLAVAMARRAMERGEPYHVIFMDLTMPVMDGWDATRQIRELTGNPLESGPTTRIVALSGSCLPADVEKAFHCGVDEFQSKPCPVRKMRRYVAEAVAN